MSPTRPPGTSSAKLLAAWVNTIAGATLTVGVLAPAAGLVYGFSVPARSAFEIGIVVSVWFVTGVVLHLAARRVLRGIEE